MINCMGINFCGVQFSVDFVVLNFTYIVLK